MRSVWSVMKSGDPELNNAHGLKRVGETACSVAPIKATNGHTFGALVSGPPAVPDELLEMICKQAGPLLERVWKNEQVLCMAGRLPWTPRSGLNDGLPTQNDKCVFPL